MQHNFLAKIVSASVLALGLTVFHNLPASATAAPPTDTVPPADTTAPDLTAPDATAPLNAPEATDEVEVETENDGFDWGWLGLLGLIGLAGLSRKNDDRVTRYREPDEVGTGSSTRY
jgi:hypothetical protein